MKRRIQDKISGLPTTPGVYFFKNKLGKILYIGKATSIRSRVKSYFVGDILEKRSPLISKMIRNAVKIDWQTSNSVLEALILEANLIKKYLPPYNTAIKDQKSWNFVVITKEDFPRVLVMRERELSTSPPSPLPLRRGGGIKNMILISSKYGPFTNGQELREALKIIRKIFPYRDRCHPNQGRACFNRQIGLCPGICTGEITKKEYSHILKNMRMILSGKMRSLVITLRKEMRDYAKKREFEKAEATKRKIFALEHVNDVALLKNSSLQASGPKLQTFRIEAYDIAHLSGTNVVGVMTVVEGGEVKKSDYRKFKVKVEQNNDVAALREVVARRFNHDEWPIPDLIVVDGGEAQMNAVKAELEKRGLNIPISAVVKDEHHKAKEILGIHQDRKNEILLANSEAHRFAITYHRKLRSNML